MWGENLTVVLNYIYCISLMNRDVEHLFLCQPPWLYLHFFDAIVRSHSYLIMQSLPGCSWNLSHHSDSSADLSGGQRLSGSLLPGLMKGCICLSLMSHRISAWSPHCVCCPLPFKAECHAGVTRGLLGDAYQLQTHLRKASRLILGDSQGSGNKIALWCGWLRSGSFLEML